MLTRLVIELQAYMKRVPESSKRRSIAPGCALHVLTGAPPNIEYLPKLYLAYTVGSQPVGRKLAVSSAKELGESKWTGYIHLASDGLESSDGLHGLTGPTGLTGGCRWATQ